MLGIFSMWEMAKNIKQDDRNSCLSPSPLKIYLRSGTKVVCRHQDAKLTYLVPKSSYSVIETDNGVHHFYFPFQDGVKAKFIGHTLTAYFQTGGPIHETL
uniref:Uncharacterized protein n=1 Tax=Romanomermis culicivorax TaxID=13658 RepID=A0A915IB82_ROMCU